MIIKRFSPGRVSKLENEFIIKLFSRCFYQRGECYTYGVSSATGFKTYKEAFRFVEKQTHVDVGDVVYIGRRKDFRK